MPDAWHPDDTDVHGGARTARRLVSYTKARPPAVLYEKERRTDGENLAIKYYFAFSSRSLVLADAEEANKVIIIAPISESDTLRAICCILYPTNYSIIVLYI